MIWPWSNNWRGNFIILFLFSCCRRLWSFCTGLQEFLIRLKVKGIKHYYWVPEKFHHKIYVNMAHYEFRLPRAIPAVSSPKLKSGMPVYIESTYLNFRICKSKSCKLYITKLSLHTLRLVDRHCCNHEIAQHKWESRLKHSEREERPKLSPPHVHSLNIFTGLNFIFILKNQASLIVWIKAQQKISV